ncbi:hypothetical protein G6F35_017674 [Rhizopus arrhizus]|nr:hypothetical protein G6F35_017674 [Rhizopus arrhizus]
MRWNAICSRGSTPPPRAGSNGRLKYHKALPDRDTPPQHVTAFRRSARQQRSRLAVLPHAGLPALLGSPPGGVLGAVARRSAGVGAGHCFTAGQHGQHIGPHRRRA